MATMMVVVGDGGGGGGKYGTPGAGVIIYLAPEIGPADTAGRFNGRTMLELTKTKTKHQLGDFFFHFSFASFTFARSLRPLPSSLLSRSLSLPRSRFLPPRVRFARFSSSVTSKKRSGEGAYNVYAWSTYMPSSVNFFSHQRRNRAPPLARLRARPPPLPLPPRLLSSRGNEIAHFKPRTRPLAPR